MAHYYINYKCEKKENTNQQNLVNLMTLTNNTPQISKNEKDQKIKKFAIEKTKNVKPNLKDFNAKFTKRENIDKKILRKFRKFIKEKNKKNLLDWIGIGLNQTQIDFWLNFIGDNMLPPMKYKENNEEFQFRSFNTKYLLWLLSHKGFINLYKIYLDEKYDELISMFIIKYSLKHNDELNQLIFYIKNLSDIFCKNYDEEIKEMDEEESDSGVKSVDTKLVSQCESQNDFDIFCFENYRCDFSKKSLRTRDNSFGKMSYGSFDYEKDYMFHDE